MTYYDHATAMAFELDRWSKERIPGSAEREATIRKQATLSRLELETYTGKSRRSAQTVVKPSFLKRCVSFIRSIRFTNTLDTP